MKRARLFCTGLILALLSASGCARLVTVEPGDLQSLNDPRWKIRPSKPAPVVAASQTADAAAAGVAVEPVVPLPLAAGMNTGAPPPPSPAEKAALTRALASPRDGFGIPRDMYQQDPMLAMHRLVMEQTAQSHHMVGGGVIGLGIFDAALAAVLFWRAGVNSDAAQAARAQGQQVASDPSGLQYFWGGLMGILAAGCLGYGISELATSRDPAALEAYYRESYDGPAR